LSQAYSAAAHGRRASASCVPPDVPGFDSARRNSRGCHETQLASRIAVRLRQELDKVLCPGCLETFKQLLESLEQEVRAAVLQRVSSIEASGNQKMGVGAEGLLAMHWPTHEAHSGKMLPDCGAGETESQATTARVPEARHGSGRQKIGTGIEARHGSGRQKIGTGIEVPLALSGTPLRGWAASSSTSDVVTATTATPGTTATTSHSQVRSNPQEAVETDTSRSAWGNLELVHDFQEALEVRWPCLQDDANSAEYLVEWAELGDNSQPVGRMGNTKWKKTCQALVFGLSPGCLVRLRVGVRSARGAGTSMGPWMEMRTAPGDEAVERGELTARDISTDSCGHQRGGCQESGCPSFVRARYGDRFTDFSLVRRCHRCGLPQANHSLNTQGLENLPKPPRQQRHSDGSEAYNRLAQMRCATTQATTWASAPWATRSQSNASEARGQRNCM